jgi:outer membrane protein OmpA-like peptidoglycan-associated protein
VSHDHIAVDSVGKRQPPVKTADGVREPRNRVVEVMLK